MTYIIIWSLLILLLLVIHRTSISKTQVMSGSDQHYHVYCIKKIKWNKHRFFQNSPEIVLPAWSYPLLYHWCLSFFPLAWTVKNSKYIALAVDILNYIIAILVLLFLMPHSEWQEFLMFSALLILNPNAMNVANARNVGLSARGFGSAFGIACFAFLFQYETTGTLYYLFAAGFMFALVFLSSEMAIQAVVLGTVSYSLLTLNIVILIALPAGFIIANIVSGGYAQKTLIYKMNHLKIYSKYLAEVFIIKIRESIWLDIFKVGSLVREKGFLKTGKYYWNSPIICFLIDFPLNFLVLVSIFEKGLFESYQNPYFFLAVLPFVLFLITSFRYTRFLGEPERYSEYFQVFSMMFLLNQNVASASYYLIVAFVVLRFLGNIILFRFTTRVHQAKYSVTDLQSYLIKGDVVATNNLDISKPLLGELPEEQYYSVYFAGITTEVVFGVEFKDLYYKYPVFKDDALITLIEKTNATVCFLSDPQDPEKVVSYLSSANFEQVFNSQNIMIFRKREAT